MQKSSYIIYLPLAALALLFAIRGLFWLSGLWSVVLLIMYLFFSKSNRMVKFRKKAIFVYSMFYFGVFVFAVIFKSLLICFYKIPSSSMEQTIMDGDVIWVDKFTYGPKMPSSPYDIPGFNLLYWATHSSQKPEDVPHWPYQRLKGMGQMEHGDIIVFENPNNSKIFIKRCVALPGDTFSLVNSQIVINRVAQPQPLDAVFYSNVVFKSRIAKCEFIKKLQMQGQRIKSVDDDLLTFHELLTYRQILELGRSSQVLTAELDTSRYNKALTVYPRKQEIKWNWDNMGPLWIPQKGSVLKLDSITFLIYREIIRKHEKCTIERSIEGILINGQLVQQYTFQNDYCFVMGDNRYDSVDSRRFGFVPLKNVIGKASRMIYSNRNGFLFKQIVHGLE